MTAAVIGGLVLASALFYLALSIAYLIGHARAMRELDDTFEIAKTLGAYGQILRAESALYGVPVEELLKRDLRGRIVPPEWLEQ